MIPESAAMKQETASTQKQVADTWATSHLWWAEAENKA
jgi:hypothetical protein